MKPVTRAVTAITVALAGALLFGGSTLSAIALVLGPSALGLSLVWWLTTSTLGIERTPDHLAGRVVVRGTARAGEQTSAGSAN